MEELLKQILTKLEVMDLKIDRIQQTIDAHHVENIETDNRLLEAIQTTTFTISP